MAKHLSYNPKHIKSAKEPWEMSKEEYTTTTTARLTKEYELGWGPTFDISDWTRNEIMEA